MQPGHGGDRGRDCGGGANPWRLQADGEIRGDCGALFGIRQGADETLRIPAKPRAANGPRETIKQAQTGKPTPAPPRSKRSPR